MKNRRELSHENKRERENSVAPDGGWGWIVVLASFCANMIIDGVNHGFGLFIPQFQQTFKSSQGLTALVGSLFASLQLISGPFASGFINKFGSRTAMFCGAIMCAFGFFLTPFCTNIVGLLITYGVIGGISCSLIYVPAIVHVAYYFEKRRALVTGISTSGSGFGLFTFAPLMAILINEYSWQGTMFFVSGAFLNCAVCASLLRPLKAPPLEEIELDWTPDSESPELPILKPKAGPLVDVLDRERVNSMDSHFKRPVPLNKSSRREFQSTSYLNRHRNHNHSPQFRKVLSRQDIFYSGSIHNLPQFSDIETYHKHMFVPQKDESSGSKPMFFAEKVAAYLKDAVDFSLLRLPVMVVLCIVNFLGMAGFFIPLFYMNNRAQFYGFSIQKASFLLSIEGISNTVGRIVFGWLADRKWFSALTMQNACMITCGCVTVAFPVVVSYESMVIYAVMFGFLIGAFNCLPSIVLVDTIGLEKLTDAFGLLILSRGISAMAGSPIAGALYDLTGTYDAPFYFGGSLILASGIVGLLIPIMTRVKGLGINEV